MELLNSSSVLQVGVRQFGKENLALYLKSVDYNGNMSIVNAIILSFLTRGNARAYHELLQGQRYANESLAHS